VANRWEPEKAGPQDTPSLFYWCYRQFRRLSDYIEGINPPGGGEANTSSNRGTGEGLALPKDGVDLPFKSLEAGTGITITDTGEELVIDAGSAGEGSGGWEVEQPNHGFDLLDCVRWDEVTEEYVLAQADDEDTLALGIIVRIPDINRFFIAQSGEWLVDHGLFQAEYYWLSEDDPGKLVIEPPDINQPMLYTRDENTIIIHDYRPAAPIDSQERNVDGGAASHIYDPTFDIDGGGAFS
jgi:hypothetical protein